MKRFFLISSSVILLLAGSQAQTTSQLQTWDLSQCINYAVVNNLTVKQAELNRNSSEISYQQSRNAFLPEISANASKNFNDVGNSTDLSATASMSFYTGGQQINAIKQDKLLMQQSDLYVQEAKNNITLSITEAYIQALYYREGMLTAQNNLEASRKQYIQAKAKYDLGSLAAKGLADVESQMANNDYQVVAAKNSYAQQVLVLKQLLELNPDQSFDIVVPEVKSDTLIITDRIDVYNKACTIMPEIQSGNVEVNISQVNLKMARNGYYPTLSLNGGLSSGQNSNNVETFATQINNNFSQYLGVSLRVPIFTKFNNRSAVQNAKIQIDKSQIELTSLQKNLYQKIEQAWMNAVSSQSELHASDLSKRAAEVAYQLSQQQFELGALSATDLLVSQNTYLNAQQKYLQTKYTCLLYYQLLQFYQGEAIKL